MAKEQQTNRTEITSFRMGQCGKLATWLVVAHPFDMLTAPSSCPASSHRHHPSQPSQMSRISKFPTDRQCQWIAKYLHVRDTRTNDMHRQKWQVAMLG